MTDDADVRATVDEFEIDNDGQRIAIIVSDDGEHMIIPVTLLPEGTSLNDVVRISISREEEETVRRRNRISCLQHRLFKRDN